MSCALLKRGCNLTCLLSQYAVENYQLFTELKNIYKNLNVIFIKTYKNIVQFILRTLNIFIFLKLSILIKNMDIDYIYIPKISIWSSLLCFFIKDKKIITVVHDVTSHKGEEHIFIDMFASYSIKRSNKIIVHSQQFIAMVMNKYGISKKNICWYPVGNYNYYVPNMVSSNAMLHYRILFFGRIHEYKGLSVLLKAMQIVLKYNHHIILRIVGHGKLSKLEENLLQKIDTNVEFIHKWVADNEIHKFFSDIDFTVLPYIEASQSGVIMLSYGFKKPVIVTNIGGLPEQVFSTTGIIIPSNDETALANAIMNLYSTPDIIFKMGKDAYNYAINELSWSKSADKLMRFMEE
jgi:glycosyltransferase involved in cell wall biosynthesis